MKEKRNEMWIRENLRRITLGFGERQRSRDRYINARDRRWCPRARLWSMRQLYFPSRDRHNTWPDRNEDIISSLLRDNLDEPNSIALGTYSLFGKMIACADWFTCAARGTHMDRVWIGRKDLIEPLLGSVIGAEVDGSRRSHADYVGSQTFEQGSFPFLHDDLSITQ